MLADEMIGAKILTAMGGPLKFYISLYCFLSSVVAQIMSILPEKIHYLRSWPPPAQLVLLLLMSSYQCWNLNTSERLGSTHSPPPQHTHTHAHLPVYIMFKFKCFLSIMEPVLAQIWILTASTTCPCAQADYLLKSEMYQLTGPNS